MRLFRLAVTVCWRALTASWRQKGKRKQVFPRAIRTTELPSNPLPLSTRDGAQLTFRNNQIQILQTSSKLGTMQPWQPTSQSEKESVQLPAVHHCCGANRGRIVSLQSGYSSPFINVSPFFLRNFGPERSMPAPSRRDVSFSGTMLTLVCPFMYIYTWASILTTSIFKTSTEVLSIVLHTSRNTQPCLVCRLKGKTLLLPHL